LEKYFNYPDRAADAGVTEDLYYEQLDQYLPTYDSRAVFDQVALTAELWERVVFPAQEANELFDENPKMTRLFTMLSPEEMSKDPVFAFNPTLPDVSNIHNATMTNLCEGDKPFELMLADGRVFRLEQTADWSEQVAKRRGADPNAAVVEILREEGASELVVDNRSLLRDAADAELDDGGCSSAGPRRPTALLNALLIAAIIGLGRRLMRPRNRT
jgi:hypothetical protein